MRERVKIGGAGRSAKRLDRLATLLKRQSSERTAALLEHLAMHDNRTMTEVLQAAIMDSGQSFYALGKASGVSKAQIARFMSGERDLRLASADKLATALGLSLSACRHSDTTENNSEL